MSDITALILGILVVLIIPAIFIGRKAKEAQDKEQRKKNAMARKQRNRRKNKKK